MAVAFWVSTDAGWNWAEANPGPLRACTSPVRSSRQVSTVPGRTGQGNAAVCERAANVL